MADNVDITPGAGATVAADLIGGVLHQRVKITVGADGVNDGDVNTACPMPIIGTDGLMLNANMNIQGVDIGPGASSLCVQDGGNTITVDGTVAVTNADITSSKTALEIMDDWDDANYCNSNMNLAGTDVTAGAGAVAAGTPRVTLASDDPAVAKLGTIDTDTGNIATDTSAIKTAVELIDNSVDGNYLNTNMNIAGTDVDGNSGNKSAQTLRVVIATDQPQLTNKLLVTPDALASGTNYIGLIQPHKYPTTDDATYKNIYYTSAGAVTDGIIWSPAAGTRWYITDMIVNVSAACTVTIEDDKAAGDDPRMKFEFAANGGFCKSFRTPFASSEDAADLLVTTTAGNIYITITGYEV